MKRTHYRKKNKKRSNKISAHFSKQDFVCSHTGHFKISLSLIGGLELLRHLAKNRINIKKGYVSPDSPEADKILHKKNYHTLGLAAEITIDNLDVCAVFKLAKEIQEFKGVGLNLAENHIHVDTRKKDARYFWVIDPSNKEIELTEENRDLYLEKKE